jgi:uncharacterized iron-regulated protein
MSRLAKVFTILAMGVIVALVWGLESEKTRLLNLADGSIESLEEVIPDLKSVKIVFFGEIHTVERIHEAQLKLIKSLHEAGVSLAIGLEMITHQHQAVLDRWEKGDLKEDAIRAVFHKDWGFPWELYRDIFSYARDNEIPMIGLNIPASISRQVALKGFSSLSEKQLKQLPPVACIVSPEYQKFIQRALGEHAHGSMSFKHFCEAQLLWDSAMAINLIDFMNKNPERGVVVLTGSGHAWKLGIPGQVRARTKVSYRVILPEVPGSLTPENVTVQDADYLWLDL